MSLFNVDLKEELSQISSASNIVIDQQLRPMLEGVLDRTGHHVDSQRRLASQDAKDIIDHAVERMETVFNNKLDQTRNDVLAASERIVRMLTIVALMIGLSAISSIVVAATVLLK
ncbi:hypothetical protein [Eoetvoesiella caeni]